MKQVLLILLLGIASQYLFAQTIQLSSVSTSAKYGYSKKDPIQVGTIPNEYVYLALLRGANGEQISYERQGTCCGFKTSNSPFGVGILDVWILTMPNGKEKKLYINGYDYEDPKCPKGLTIGRTSNENK